MPTLVAPGTAGGAASSPAADSRSPQLPAAPGAAPPAGAGPRGRSPRDAPARSRSPDGATASAPGPPVPAGQRLGGCSGPGAAAPRRTERGGRGAPASSRGSTGARTCPLPLLLRGPHRGGRLRGASRRRGLEKAAGCGPAGTSRFPDARGRSFQNSQAGPRGFHFRRPPRSAPRGRHRGGRDAAAARPRRSPNRSESF